MLKMELLLTLFVYLTVMLDLVPNQLVLFIVRRHSASLIDILKTKHTVSEIGISNCAEIIPFGSTFSR